MATRGLEARAAQRSDAGGYGGRSLYRYPDRELSVDRDRVQPAWPGQDHCRCAEPARLYDAAGLDGDLLLPDRGGEPDHRCHVWHHRSAGEAVSEARQQTPPPLAGGGWGGGGVSFAPGPPPPTPTPPGR